MKALDQPFTKIINGTTQFVIPVFQRDYRWTDAQCAQLWRDVLRVGAGDADAIHFLGSVVYAPTGDTSAGFTRWLLIDGQQRVTTLILLLTALRDHLEETGWKAADEDGPTVARINAYFLKNTQEEGAREKKLVLRRHDQATLAALVDRQETPGAASERIQENYEFFRDQLTDSDPALVYRGIGRLVIVDVTLDPKTDDPQMVFESLNSTGMDLSQADLIRNYVLMRLKERDQTRIYEDYWSKIEALFRGSESAFDAFARDFMALQTKPSKQEKASEIYRVFREFYPDWQENVGGLERAMEEMLRYARYYAYFIGTAPAPVPVKTPLARLRHLVDVPAILVMRLFHAYERGSLEAGEFVQALALVESYVFRRSICGLQTRGYWQVFANMAYRISETQALVDLKVALARQHESYRYPNDEEFRRNLLERDIYGLRVAKYLLEQLENHGSNEPSDTSGYTIEHILPQNENLPMEWRRMLGDGWREVQEVWVHRLGNLTLTGYNSNYQDSPFSDKKTMPGGFSDSAVRLNRFVREQTVWTAEVIERRGGEMADRALRIWPELHVEPHLIEAAKEQDLRERAAKGDVSRVRFSPTARPIFYALRERVLEFDSDVFEVPESKSVSYYGPQFFLEVLPRKHRILLLLPLEFREIDDPLGRAEDATQWSFFFYAQHEGGVALSIESVEEVDYAISIVQQAYSAASV